MAKRRLRDRVLAGLGQGVTDAGGLLLRTHMQDKLQSRYDDRAQRGQEAILDRQKQMTDQAAVIDILKTVADGGRDPQQAISMITALTGQQLEPYELDGVRPSPRRRIEKAVGGDIDKATTPEAIPDDATIFGKASAEGLDYPPVLEGPMSDNPMDHVRPEVREMTERAGARRRTLREMPTETVSVQRPDGGEETQFVSKHGGPVQTKPDAATQGVIKGTTETESQKTVLGDDDLTKLKGTTQGRIENMVEALTRQAKVTTAAAVAGATKRAGLAPDIIAAEVDRGKQLAAGKENSTESERRAATNWAPLVKAHDLATQMEKSGASIGLLDPTLSKWPIANRAVSKGSQQYMQAARDFISTLGLIRSGVTVRPDEAESLFATMFRMEGEGATQLANKQKSREIFLASMQAMVGRSGDEAGRILAEAINRGQISKNVLESLQFENEGLKQSLLKNLRGVPKFDLQGNLIGVQ